MFELLRTTTGCGVDEFCTDVGVKKTLRYAGYAIFVVKIILPLIIIVLATIDLGKAIGNPDEEIKNSIFTILKRIASALIIYFIPTILNFAISDVFDFQKVKDCAECMFKPFECEISDNPIKCITKTDSISISDCSNGMTVPLGDRKKLYIQYQPADAENKGVTFKSSSDNVSVNKFGEINAKKEGSSTITATLNDDKNIKTSCKIKVKKYETKSSSSTATTGASLIGNYKYFAQWDFQWQSHGFCGYSPRKRACGAFALTMVVDNLTNKNIQPTEVMDFICQNDSITKKTGYTTTSMLNSTAIPSMKFQSKYGVKSTDITQNAGRASADTLNKLDDRLKKGEMLVCLVPFHFITMIGDSNGNVTILDPGSSQTNKTFSNVKDAYNFIYDFWKKKHPRNEGGAIWAYSKAK